MSDQEMLFTGERLIPGQVDQVTFWEHIYRYRFALNYLKNKRVLDIASGEGYGTAALSKAGVKEIIGIDISEEACNYARKKYGLDFRIGNAQSIPLESNTLDTVISFETIEHLESPELFLRECARTLKPNGKLILSTPNKMSSLVNKDNEFHTKLYSLDEITSLVSKYFTNLKVFSQCPETMSLLSIRNLTSLRSPLNKYNKYKKIRNKLRYFWCKHAFDPELTKFYTDRPVDAILHQDSFFSRYVNPYRVSKYMLLEKETPMFFILEVTK